MWITNGAIAGVAVVWARAEDGIRGFLVPAGTPGFSATRMRGKLSMCASITELILDDVRLPADVLRTAVEYASTRTQFGRPIAGFQLT